MFLEDARKRNIESESINDPEVKKGIEECIELFTKEMFTTKI